MVTPKRRQELTLGASAALVRRAGRAGDGLRRARPAPAPLTTASSGACRGDGEHEVDGVLRVVGVLDGARRLRRRGGDRRARRRGRRSSASAASSMATTVSPATTPAAAAGPLGSTALIVSEPLRVGVELHAEVRLARRGRVGARRRGAVDGVAQRALIDGHQLRAVAALRAQGDDVALVVDHRGALGDLARAPRHQLQRAVGRDLHGDRRRLRAEQGDHVAVVWRAGDPDRRGRAGRVRDQHREAVDRDRHPRDGGLPVVERERDGVVGGAHRAGGGEHHRGAADDDGDGHARRGPGAGTDADGRLGDGLEARRRRAGATAGGGGDVVRVAGVRFRPR